MVIRSKRSAEAEINKLIKAMPYKKAKTIYWMIQHYLNQEAINSLVKEHKKYQ